MKIIFKLTTLFLSIWMFTPALCQGIKQKGGPYYEKAYNAYFTEQNDKLALELINFAIKNDKEYLTVPAFYHSLKADIYCVLNDNKNCIAEAEKALNIDKSIAKPYFRLGNICFENKKYNDAVLVFSVGIERSNLNSPNYLWLYEYRGRARYLVNDFIGAISDYTFVINNNVDEYDKNGIARIHLFRSLVLYETGQEMKAKLDLNYSLKLNPNDNDAKELLSLMKLADMAGLLNSLLNGGNSSSTNYDLNRQPLDWDRNGMPIYGPSIREGGYDQNGVKKN